MWRDGRSQSLSGTWRANRNRRSVASPWKRRSFRVAAGGRPGRWSVALIGPLWLLWASVGWASAPASEASLGTLNGAPIRVSDLTPLILADYAHQAIGQETLEHLIQEEIVAFEARRREILVDPSQITRRRKVLEEQLRQGNAPSLTEFLRDQGLSLAQFEDLLGSAIRAEIMIRDDFGLSNDAEIPAEKQKVWFHEKRAHLGVRTEGLSKSVAARVAEKDIRLGDWAKKIYWSLSAEERDRLFEDFVTIRLLEAKAASLEIAITPQDVREEIERRDEQLRIKLKAEGMAADKVTYLDMIEARGEASDEHLESEKFRANIYQRLLAERIYGADGYRSYYVDRKDEFDREFGRRVKLSLIFLRAGDEVSETIPRRYGDALEQLQELRQRIENETNTELHTSFDRMARMFSEHASRNQGGDLGFLTEPALAALELPSDPFSHPEGTILGPWQARQGVCLGMVTGSQPAAGFDDLRPEIEKHARRELTRSLRESAHIQRES